VTLCGILGHKSWCSRKFVSKTLGVRAVLRRSVETRPDVHGQHAEQKAAEDLQNRMAGRGDVADIPDREHQYRRDKDTDHVSVRADLPRSVETRRDVHGQHPKQKASENMQGRMAGRAAVAEIPDREEQYPGDKDTDHVSAKA